MKRYPKTQIGKRMFKLMDELKKHGISSFTSSYVPLTVFKFDENGKVERNHEKISNNK